jgi:D-alanyl-D-alanine carboxypeptidase-like protein
MRNGGSGLNPAAPVSWHQAGMAVDINGTTSSAFPQIINAMESQGLTWGGTFHTPDRPHFQLPGAGTLWGHGSRIILAWPTPEDIKAACPESTVPCPILY